MSLNGGTALRKLTKNSRVLRTLASNLALAPETRSFLLDGEFVLGRLFSAFLSMASPQTIFSPILSSLCRPRIHLCSDLGMSSLAFASFPKSWVTGDCNEGCQNPATSLQAGFCQGDPLGEPSPSATPAIPHSRYTFWNRRLLMVIYLLYVFVPNNN